MVMADSPDCFDKPFRRTRLGQQSEGGRFQRSLHEVAVRIARVHNHGNRPEILSDFLQRARPIQPHHHQVQHHDVRSFSAHLLQGFAASRDRRDIKTIVLEDEAQRFAHLGIIVDDEDVRGFCGRLLGHRE